MKANCHVWLWLDDAGRPAYLGRGRSVAGVMPWQKLWRDRAANDSELGDWLCLQSSPPQRSADVPSCELAKPTADMIFRDLRKQCGKLLSDRQRRARPATRTTWAHPREVIGPGGEVYKSVRAAATANGISPARITQLCQQNRKWHYATATD